MYIYIHVYIYVCIDRDNECVHARASADEDDREVRGGQQRVGIAGLVEAALRRHHPALPTVGNGKAAYYGALAERPFPPTRQGAAHSVPFYMWLRAYDV
jgi:hypothetical protein